MDNYPALSLARNRIAHTPTRGDCHIRRNISEDHTDSWIDVVHADPQVLVADEVLRGLNSNTTSPPQLEVWLQPPANRPPCEWGTPCPHFPCWSQWFLHIDGRNRTVIYRIGRYVAELHAWEASWPD